jgi:hypothetical protein
MKARSPSLARLAMDRVLEDVDSVARARAMSETRKRY